jgi:hypothetical protein
VELFLRTGLVDPVDDFRSTNPPTHPELLARLAEDFRTHNHDLRRLMRLVVTSRTYNGCLRMTREQASRRDFLRVGSLGFLGIHTNQYLCAASAAKADGNAKAQACILLWLEGGPSHVDTWDPKSTSAFKAISSNVPGIQVSELLPQVARRMDKLAIVRSMHTRKGTTIRKVRITPSRRTNRIPRCTFRVSAPSSRRRHRPATVFPPMHSRPSGRRTASMKSISGTVSWARITTRCVFPIPASRIFASPI